MGLGRKGLSCMANFTANSQALLVYKNEERYAILTLYEIWWHHHVSVHKWRTEINLAPNGAPSKKKLWNFFCFEKSVRFRALQSTSEDALLLAKKSQSCVFFPVHFWSFLESALRFYVWKGQSSILILMLNGNHAARRILTKCTCKHCSK